MMVGETTRAEAPISVVVPTVGRPALLEGCLRSIRAGNTQPAELIVIDQSGSGAVTAITESFGARRIPCAGRGIPLAVNEGVREATQSLVAITHDDCEVDDAWVETAAALADEDPEALITGRVQPLGDPRLVPACRDQPDRLVFREGVSFGALLPNNMAFDRDSFLEFGGFDERFDVVGEDLDMSHRWARGERTIRYEPAMIVRHREWRKPAELRRTYQEYARGAGIFYIKNLREGDRFMLGLIAGDARDYFKALARGLRQRRWDPADPALGFFPGTFIGIWQGLRRFP